MAAKTIAPIAMIVALFIAAPALAAQRRPANADAKVEKLAERLDRVTGDLYREATSQQRWRGTDHWRSDDHWRRTHDSLTRALAWHPSLVMEHERRTACGPHPTHPGPDETFCSTPDRHWPAGG